MTDTQRRFREQKGQVIERSDGWYLRFYVDDPATGRRVKVSERLAVKDDADMYEVGNARRKRMKAINANCHADRKMPAGDMLISDVWTNYFLPDAKERLRWSTWHGMENRWRQYLEPHLGKQAIRRYTTGDASRFLTALAKKKLARGGEVGLGVHSLAHVRSLMSCIFNFAVNKELIDRNPISEVKVYARVRKPKPTIEYSVDEMRAILDAIPRTDAKLFFALCSFLALRPSEAAAVSWESIDLEALTLKVEDAASYGHPGDGLKTEASKRTLLLTEPAASLARAWHEECGGDDAEGYLFQRPGGLPVNHNAFARRHIGKFAKKVCPRWCGCYAGRRGGATHLYNQSGDVRAAYQVLGNSLAVVMAKYVKPSVAEGQAGQRALEAEYLKATAGRA
jgi:integrase